MGQGGPQWAGSECLTAKDRYGLRAVPDLVQAWALPRPAAAWLQCLSHHGASVLHWGRPVRLSRPLTGQA